MYRIHSFHVKTHIKLICPLYFLSIVSFEQQLKLLRLTSSELNPKTTVRFASPTFSSKMHSRYYRLPKVLWDYIWTYDHRYRTEFKNCVFELNHYFNHNRTMELLKVDRDFHEIYTIINTRRGSKKPLFGFSAYILEKRRIFGDQTNNENLKHTALKTIQTLAIDTRLQS